MVNEQQIRAHARTLIESGFYWGLNARAWNAEQHDKAAAEREQLTAALVAAILEGVE